MHSFYSFLIRRCVSVGRTAVAANGSQSGHWICQFSLFRSFIVLFCLLHALRTTTTTANYSVYDRYWLIRRCDTSSFKFDNEIYPLLRSPSDSNLLNLVWRAHTPSDVWRGEWVCVSPCSCVCECLPSFRWLDRQIHSLNWTINNNNENNFCVSFFSYYQLLPSVIDCTGIIHIKFDNWLVYFLMDFCEWNFEPISVFLLWFNFWHLALVQGKWKKKITLDFHAVVTLTEMTLYVFKCAALICKIRLTHTLSPTHLHV